MNTRALELLQDRRGQFPAWIRPPKRGIEFWSGLSRSKMYALAAQGLIRSISLREAGQLKACRLFDLTSILSYYEKIAAKQANQAAKRDGHAEEATK